jgi:hypothetical protein
MSSTSVTNAEKFFVDRILEQAKRDGSALSEVEIRMIRFSEATASTKDLEVAAVFERDFNDQEYEAKIAKLLKSAYQHDKESGEGAVWVSALDELADEDMYLFVMIEQAGICGSCSLSNWFDWRLILGLWPACIAVTVGIVLAFTPFGVRVIPNGLLRLALLIFLLVCPLLIGNVKSKIIE